MKEHNNDATENSITQSEAGQDGITENNVPQDAAPLSGEQAIANLHFAALTDEQADHKVPTNAKRKKASLAWSIIRTVIALAIIALGIFIILYLVARAAKYDSIAAMLQAMFIELELMWQRIIY